jgi:hypothetical protein
MIRPNCPQASARRAATAPARSTSTPAVALVPATSHISNPVILSVSRLNGLCPLWVFSLQGAHYDSPRITPNQDQVDLPPPRRPDQILALWALANARPNVLHRQDDGPSAMIGELAHGRGLQWQRLLVVSGDAGIEADALIYTPLPLSLFTAPTYSVFSIAFIRRLAGRSRHES